jgi:hypothetical protein
MTNVVDGIAGEGDFLGFLQSKMHWMKKKVGERRDQ